MCSLVATYQFTEVSFEITFIFDVCTFFSSLSISNAIETANCPFRDNDRLGARCVQLLLSSSFFNFNAIIIPFGLSLLSERENSFSFYLDYFLLSLSSFILVLKAKERKN